MKLSNSKNESWHECQSGELVRFAVKQRARALRRNLLRIGGTTTLLIAVVFFLGYQFSRSNLRGDPTQPNEGGTPNFAGEPNYGGIRCSEVRANAAAHLAGQLEAATEAKVLRHLEQCPICIAYMQQISGQPISDNRAFTQPESQSSTFSRLISINIRLSRQPDTSSTR